MPLVANINVAKDTAVLAHLKVGTSEVTATNTTGATTADSHLPATGITRAYDGTALLFERPTIPPTTESPITLPGIVVITRGILDKSAERTIVPRRLAYHYGLQLKALNDVTAKLKKSIDTATERIDQLNDDDIGAELVTILPTIGQFRQDFYDTNLKDEGNYQQESTTELGPELIGYVKEPFTIQSRQIGWLLQPLDPSYQTTQFLVRNSDYCGRLDKYDGETRKIAHVDQRVVFTPAPPPEPKKEESNSPRKRQRSDRPRQPIRTEEPQIGARHVRMLPELTLSL